jgi:DNA uptake protein ComE-like DNA-binding protein
MGVFKMAVTKKGSVWEFKKSVWIIWSFILLLNGVGMYRVGKKVKVKKWRNYGLLYTASTWIGVIAVSEFTGSILEDIGMTIFFIGWIGCIIHCFRIRKECLVRLEILEEQKVEQREADNLRSKIAKEYGINNIIENTISSQPKVSTMPPVIPKVEVDNKSMEIKEEKLVDINTCSEIELSELPGIGIILAKKVVNLRGDRDTFSSVDEFIQELGVKPHYVEKLKMRICCTQVKTVESIKTVGRMVDF